MNLILFGDFKPFEAIILARGMYETLEKLDLLKKEQMESKSLKAF